MDKFPLYYIDIVSYKLYTNMRRFTSYFFKSNDRYPLPGLNPIGSPKYILYPRHKK